jgi:hypothetical protein
MEDGDIRGEMKVEQNYNRDRKWAKKMSSSFGSIVPAFSSL